MYKKISEISNEEDLLDVQDELLDRFGEMPGCVQNLLDIAVLKSAAHKIGVISIIQKQSNVVLKFKPDSDVDVNRLLESVKNNNKKLFLSGGGTPYLTYKITEGDNKFILDMKRCVEEIG